MPNYEIHLIDSLLDPKDDAFDSQRSSTRDAIASGDPSARKTVFELANALWMPVATEAWNDGERSPEINATCGEAKQLCEWVYGSTVSEDEDRYDVGGAITTAGMMRFILGDTDGALELFGEITKRPPNTYFHESTFEKTISILVKENRIDEALVEIDRMLEVYPNNELANNCKSAYAQDQANESLAGGASQGMKIDMDAYTQVTTALAALFQQDMEQLMTAGLPQAEMQSHMESIQAAYQVSVEQVSRLI